MSREATKVYAQTVDIYMNNIALKIHSFCEAYHHKHCCDMKITLFNYTHQHTHIYIYIYYLRSLKFILKHLKRSNMFRPHDHPQGAHFVPC